MKNKILVLEDDKYLLASIREILTLHDFNVVAQDSAVNAEEVIKEFQPDLIICDIMMPDRTGLQLLKAIKNIPDYEYIPFIFLTARADYNDVRLGMNLGADDYLVKPFKASDILASIELRLKKQKYVREQLEGISSNITRHIPHELRTPLISILGFPNIIIDEINNLSKSEIVSFAEKIKYSALRLQSIVEKFILYADLEATMTNKDFREEIKKDSSCEIKEIIQLEAKNCSKIYDRTSDLTINAESACVQCSGDYLNRIIQELADNSFKFSDPGTPVVVEGKKSGNKYIVTISDNGAGMDKTQLELLNAFIQFNQRMYGHQGNGLGIALVKKILQLYDSELIIKSEKEKGTTISFSLNLS